MRPSSILGVTLVSGVLLATGACSGGGDDDPHPTMYDCEKEMRDEEFVTGLAKPGDSGRIEFKLLSSDPAPPARGDNTWILQLSTMAAPVTPISGASVDVSPFMPDHNHPAGKNVIVTPQTEAGQYKLEPVNLWMPGLWEITIDASATDTDRVVFRFCLPS